MNNQSLEQILHGKTVRIDATTEIPMFKYLCRKWMMDTSITRYQVAVQRQMIETARKQLAELENELVVTYGEKMRTHFISNEIGNDAKTFLSQKKGIGLMTRTNEDEDPEIVQCIRANKKGGVYGKVMLAGMNILQYENRTPVEAQPKAMLINLAKSDDSMSGVTTVSKSSHGTISWDKDVQGRELTSERMKDKIIRSCAKYDIKHEEVKIWAKENIKDTTNPIHRWNLKQMHELIEWIGGCSSQTYRLV